LWFQDIVRRAARSIAAINAGWKAIAEPYDGYFRTQLADLMLGIDRRFIILQSTLNDQSASPF
jgi:hypothetical protein